MAYGTHHPISGQQRISGASSSAMVTRIHESQDIGATKMTYEEQGQPLGAGPESGSRLVSLLEMIKVGG